MMKYKAEDNGKRGHKKGRLVKRLVICLVSVIALWVVAFATDYLCVFAFAKRPVFTLSRLTYDETGSGIYRGLLYSYEIKNQEKDIEDNTVSGAELYLLGMKISSKAE
ncbi:MAG: hypothetical protein RR058_05655 [Oscillospiraceae bacterium]